MFSDFTITAALDFVKLKRPVSIVIDNCQLENYIVTRPLMFARSHVLN